MTSKVCDSRGNRPARQITSRPNLCVYRAKDKNGEMTLFITAPEPESPEITKVVSEVYGGIMPKALADDFQRIAMLIRIAKYYLFAASAPNDLKEKMSEMGTKFEELYHQFCDKLQKLMVFSFEMFEKFKAACYFYDGKDEECGADTLQAMQSLWTKAQQIHQDLDRMMDCIEKDAKCLSETLKMRKEYTADQFEACLSKCSTGVGHIHSFLSQQKVELKKMHDAFNLKQKCATIQGRLNVRTFQEMTSMSAGHGFLLEVHNTILRCVAMKHISGSFTRELTSKRASFTQMVSASPVPAMAKRNLPGLITEFNKKFPDYSLDEDEVKEGFWSKFCVMM